ncbi:molybdopterin molybdotransferase [uncultured bacterium]|nr:molybdopterin molybdotransferase [uncultured bacterium]
MKEFFKVLDIETVLGLVPQFRPVDAEPVDLDAAGGRILAEDVFAAERLPDFARSTVDGYALRAASTFGASESSPALFQVIGAVAMGETARMTVSIGEAVRIATGGMLPPGADSVVMIEHAEAVDDTAIEVIRSVAPGQNLIAAGEDFEAGARIAARGRCLRPQDMGVLAAFGRARIQAFRLPVVGIISTGDELVPIDAVPAPAQVRDVNSYTLAGLVAETGSVSKRFGIIKDDFPSLYSACARALECCDMVLISGGSSVGVRDYTVEAISAFAGSEILVHGIAISPGKPTILARVGRKALWGLPGHVVSAMIVFTRITRPFLRHIGGRCDPYSADVSIPARLSRNVASVQGRTDFIRVRLTRHGAELWAEPVLGKSGLLNTMVHADGIIEIGKNIEGLEEGTSVEVILF